MKKIFRSVLIISLISTAGITTLPADEIKVKKDVIISHIELDQIETIKKKFNKSDNISTLLLSDVMDGDMKTFNNFFIIMEEAFGEKLYIISGYLATVLTLVADLALEKGQKVGTEQQIKKIREVNKKSLENIVMRHAWVKMLKEVL